MNLTQNRIRQVVRLRSDKLVNYIRIMSYSAQGRELRQPTMLQL